MLKSQNRLKEKQAFGEIFKAGKSFRNDVLMLKYTLNKANSASKIGFSVGVKFSKRATDRNKVKRWLREAVREKVPYIKPGLNIILYLNPKQTIDQLNLIIISEKVDNLLKKANLFLKS